MDNTAVTELEKKYGFLKELQDANFLMLCELDRICRKCGIKYYLLAGTLLGAVRHGDFIPWDDDVDVVFPRKDYMRFLKVFPRYASSRYSLVKVEQYPQFRSFINRIVDNDMEMELTTELDDFYGQRFSHPSIDLFIFDNAPENMALVSFRLKLIYGLALSRCGAIVDNQKNLINKIAVHTLALIGKLFPIQFLYRSYDRVCRITNKKNEGSESWFISNDQLKPMYWAKLYKKEWFARPASVKLRGREFPAAADADAMLKLIYKDYMSIPPADKQVPEHFKGIKRKKD